MSSTLCAAPLQCAAIHEMSTHMAEMNSKLTSVTAMLQMFFDSWKRSETAKGFGIVPETELENAGIQILDMLSQPLSTAQQTTSHFSQQPITSIVTSTPLPTVPFSPTTTAEASVPVFIPPSQRRGATVTDNPMSTLAFGSGAPSQRRAGTVNDTPMSTLAFGSSPPSQRRGGTVTDTPMSTQAFGSSPPSQRRGGTVADTPMSTQAFGSSPPSQRRGGTMSDTPISTLPFGSVPPSQRRGGTVTDPISTLSFGRPEVNTFEKQAEPGPSHNSNRVQKEPRKEIETIVIKEEDDDLKMEDGSIPAVGIYGDSSGQFVSEFSHFDHSGPSPSTSQTSNDGTRKRKAVEDPLSWDTDQATSAGIGIDYEIAPWDQPSTSDAPPFQISAASSFTDFEISPDVIAKAADVANKAGTLEQRIKKFAWQLVVRTIPVGHMWDLMGAVTCSSKDASSATDLLAKQKEPVRTILKITLDQYKIGEEHVGKEEGWTNLKMVVEKIQHGFRNVAYRFRKQQQIMAITFLRSLCRALQMTRNRRNYNLRMKEKKASEGQLPGGMMPPHFSKDTI